MVRLQESTHAKEGGAGPEVPRCEDDTEGNHWCPGRDLIMYIEGETTTWVDMKNKVAPWVEPASV